MPDASGNGYWLVTNTGHVYAFGDAVRLRTTQPQSVPVTSAVRTTDGKGLLAPLLQWSGGALRRRCRSRRAHQLCQCIQSRHCHLQDSDGEGYWVASANGSVFTYGTSPYDGGMAGLHLNGAIIAGTGW
jgi:hypothetical protein